MRTKRPTSERFLEKVENRPSGCHEWIGCLMPNGYGQFHLNGKTAYAHRVAYEIANGPFPKEAFVMHSCDNRKCVNPDHLSLGTFDLNMADMVDKGRQAHGVKNPHAGTVSNGWALEGGSPCCWTTSTRTGCTMVEGF